MPEKPFYSIIIPVYNAEKYLHECMKSVFTQTFSDFEVILVDDDSKDSSLAMCNEFAKNGQGKIRVFHKNNEGATLARWYGMRQARGKYLVSLDADDMLRHDALEIIHNTILNFGSDLVLFNFSTKKDFSAKGRNLPLKTNKILDKKDVYKVVLQGDSLNNIWMKVFPVEYADTTKGLANFSHIKKGGDLLQSLMPLTKCNTPIFVDECLYYYRPVENSIVHSFHKDCFLWTCEIGKIMCQKAREWGFKDGEWEKLVYTRYLSKISENIRHYVYNYTNYSELKSCLENIRCNEFFKTCLANYDKDKINRKNLSKTILVQKGSYFLLYVYGRIKMLGTR